MGLVTVVDGEFVEGLVINYVRATLADREVQRRGLVVDTPHGPKANPALKVSEKAWAAVRSFGVEFGLSPSSRARVRATPVPTDAEKFLAKFGGGGAR
jgi:P27 family predicted phage terminase small subunit